ncbi:MAG: hypothetical protein GXX91_15330 [Verrucomicrobiaceae bacterium]|nr:hypothetical protein [Verrucomicrobiaceae bacterium]
MLPEEELRFLVRLFFRPRMRKDSLLDSAMEGGSDRLREVGREFLDRDFASAGIERLCLEQLPMRIGEFPDLDAWLESRRGDRTFSDFLESDEETFLSEWPYWSKRIEVLMDTGNFEAIGEMLPGSDWFAGKNRDHPSPSWAGPNTREEILWMGFARSVGPILYFGSRQARRDAAEVVSKLLQSPPLLHEKRTPKSLYGTAAKWNHTVWTFRMASVQELSDLGLAALLAASLEDSEEMALQECETISLFRRPMVVGEERIHAESGQHFLAVVLGIAQTLDEESKEKLLLRAFKTAPFQPSVVGRHEFPCHTLSRRVRPPELSIPFLEEMAKLRLAQSPEDPVLIGDYGLMLIGGNKVEEATPVLERALQLLPALDQENLVNEIAETLVDLKRRK